jgi:hypothetical protein
LLPFTGGGGAEVESRPPFPANAVPGRARASAAAQPSSAAAGLGTHADLGTKSVSFVGLRG